LDYHSVTGTILTTTFFFFFFCFLNFPGRHEYVEGLAILAAVFIVSAVTAVNDWSKDRKFRQLSAIAKDRKIKVIRNGEQTLVSVYDLLVGDVLFLTIGDIIPADGLLISGHGTNIRCFSSPIGLIQPCRRCSRR